MKYTAMEWSELSAASGIARGPAVVHRLASGDIQLHAFELNTGDQTPELVLDLTPDLEVRSASAGDSFWA